MSIKENLPEEVFSGLKQLLSELNMIEYKLEIKDSVAKGENFLGIVKKVKVQSHSRTTNLIVKYATQNDMRKYFRLEICFRTEVYMYQKVFAMLLQFQREMKIKDLYIHAPKLYKACLTPPYEYLIMEDMTCHGFVMRNKKTYPDLKHCRLAMGKYGTYHALCLALRQKNRDVYDTLLENSREAFFIEEQASKLSETISASCENIINVLDKSEEGQLIEKLERFKTFPIWGLADTLSPEKSGDITVFCHGDCWSNNLLYKYNKNDIDQSEPIDVCILDWQLSRCASPATDLSYFLFVSTDTNMRTNHYHELLRTYHEKLTAQLDQLDCHEVFTFEDLQRHMKIFGGYGLMMTMIVLPLLEMESNDMPTDWQGEMPDEERTSIFKAKKTDHVTLERLKHIVRDYDRLVHFDF